MLNRTAPARVDLGPILRTTFNIMEIEWQFSHCHRANSRLRYGQRVVGVTTHLALSGQGSEGKNITASFPDLDVAEVENLYLAGCVRLVPGISIGRSRNQIPWRR